MYLRVGKADVFKLAGCDEIHYITVWEFAGVIPEPFALVFESL